LLPASLLLALCWALGPARAEGPVIASPPQTTMPGTPQSSPVRIGDNIYFTIGNQVVAVDADPTANDSSVRVGSGEQVYGVVSQITYGGTGKKTVDHNHVRWTSKALAGGTGLGSPVGGEGVLAVNTQGTGAGGTTLFSEGITVLADNNRIMEVDADGGAL